MTTGRMIARTCLAVVLAAGEGTRMRSSRPKVLHAIGGRSLIAHVLVAVGTTGGPAAPGGAPRPGRGGETREAHQPGAQVSVPQERPAPPPPAPAAPAAARP